MCTFSFRNQLGVGGGGQQSGSGLCETWGESRRNMPEDGNQSHSLGQPCLDVQPGWGCCSFGRYPKPSGSVAWKKGGPPSGDGSGWEGELEVAFAATLSQYVFTKSWPCSVLGAHPLELAMAGTHRLPNHSKRSCKAPFECFPPSFCLQYARIPSSQQTEIWAMSHICV